VRVPGSLAEIEGSPDGPQVGAFFDFDGTLIAGYSAAAIAEDRMRRRDITLADVGRTMRVGLQFGMGRADFNDFMKLTAEGWRGRSHGEMEELGERLFVQRISDLVYPEARELVAAHQRKGHTVALTSSATRYQVVSIARELGIEHVLCTELEVENELLTGNVLGPSLWGEGKAEAVQKFAAEHGIDLGDSYFYADGNEDVALMHLVGKPRPTNPGRRLEAVARRRGWPIQRFTSRGRTTPAMRVRNLAGALSLGPIAAASAAVGLVQRDRRAALNMAADRWFDVMLGLTGVRLRVVGEEHLRSPRPAVFVFNHRTAFDPLLAASLVRHDFTMVVRTDLARNPLVGALGRFVDLTLVAPWATVDAPPGLSVLTADEQDAKAMGMPVVRIHIRNAERLGPRNATVVRPGTVDIDVLA
jgi:putative phosphoserine phosphatase/1-acylglycerol-3-phosphate O-acyltransferase